MLYKNIRNTLCIMLAAVVLTGCNTEDSGSNVDITKEHIESTKNKTENKQQLKTYNGTKNISFVSNKHIKFWDAIAVNNIDNNYNKTKIKKGNIRLRIKANKDYIEEWLSELEETYETLRKIIPEDYEDDLNKQYDKFMDYYENTDKLYTYVLDVDDEYESKVDGYYKARQYYALADDVRTYTTLLKEYIYLLNLDVKFYTDDSKKKILKATYIDNSPNITYSIITDIKFRDIINDEYKNKVRCNIKGLDNKKAIKKSKIYTKYWKNEVDDNYDILKDTLKGEHKDIIKAQKKSYIAYVESSTKLQKYILHKSKFYKNLYKENVSVENNIYKGKKMMKYNILLREYYYAISGKIN